MVGSPDRRGPPIRRYSKVLVASSVWIRAIDVPRGSSGPDYDQRLRAFNARGNSNHELSKKFVNSDYRLKQLLAEMVLAAWYRSETPEALLEDGIET